MTVTQTDAESEATASDGLRFWLRVTAGPVAFLVVATLPLAADVGYNPAILARIIAGTALAVSFPWSGAPAGTAFASGSIGFTIGVVATVFTVIAITTLSMILVPAPGAFTAP